MTKVILPLTENEGLKISNGVLWFVVIILFVVSCVSIKWSYKYKTLFENEVVEHGACIVSLKGDKK